MITDPFTSDPQPAHQHGGGCINGCHVPSYPPKGQGRPMGSLGAVMMLVFPPGIKPYGTRPALLSSCSLGWRDSTEGDRTAPSECGFV